MTGLMPLAVASVAGFLTRMSEASRACAFCDTRSVTVIAYTASGAALAGYTRLIIAFGTSRTVAVFADTGSVAAVAYAVAGYIVVTGNRAV